MILTPSIRPFRWARMLWTYMIPVVPFVLFYDGVVSCLRAYSLEEFEERIVPLKRGNVGVANRRGPEWIAAGDLSAGASIV